MPKKKFWASFQRIIEIFNLSKIWVRDPEKTYYGSRIRVQGIKKAPDPGSGSAALFA